MHWAPAFKALSSLSIVGDVKGKNLQILMQQWKLETCMPISELMMWNLRPQANHGTRTCYFDFYSCDLFNNTHLLIKHPLSLTSENLYHLLESRVSWYDMYS